MTNAWSIKIVELADGTVAFEPDVPGATPGQPLGAKTGDLVTWNNRTNQAHWPVATSAQTFLTNDIPAGQVSDPIFQVQSMVTYSCRHHPHEQGVIEVVTD